MLNLYDSREYSLVLLILPAVPLLAAKAFSFVATAPFDRDGIESQIMRTAQNKCGDAGFSEVVMRRSSPDARNNG